MDVYIWAQIANTHQGVAFICMVLLLLHFVDFCYCMLRRFPNSNTAPAYQGLSQIHIRTALLLYSLLLSQYNQTLPADTTFTDLDAFILFFQAESCLCKRHTQISSLVDTSSKHSILT